ncbi:MAG TPA: NlpC/P60 family protein [Ilumatobacteraceae bacterium]|jgi:cell wall-associated NlpC family hydrolase
MRFRGILSHRSVAAAIAVCSLFASTTVADAGSVGSEKQKVAAIADQLDTLENRLGQLDEDYGAAQDKKAALDQDIADSQARIAQQQARLDQLASVLGDIAVDKYVTGSALELSPLFSNAAAYTEAEQKDSFSRLALDNGAGSTDEMLALAEDLAKEQASLSRKQAQAADLVTTLNTKLAQGQQLQVEYQQKLASAQADLGAAIDQERERRAEASAAAEIAKQKAAAAAAAAASSKSASARAVQTTPRGGGISTNAPAPAAGAGNAAPAADPGNGGDAAPVVNAPPPVSSMAGIAVNAAMGQLGVPYRFAAESPGVAFDCSGLTKYAWGQAGVYLPHQSGAQYGSIPHVSQSDVQPGDLIFYKSPIGHVAIYIGGGSMIHAPRTGDVVKVSAVNWAAVVGIGRPG